MQAGALVLVDGARRLAIPWVGPLEPLVVGGETALANALTSAAYRRSGAERFANEYQRLATDPVWKDIVKVEGVPNPALPNNGELGRLALFRKRLLGR